MEGLPKLLGRSHGAFSSTVEFRNGRNALSTRLDLALGLLTDWSMRQALRYANALLWLGIWVAIAFYSDALNDPPRLIAETIIPGFLWLAIDYALREQTGSDT